MDEPLRIGVAGLGFGAAVHIPTFQSLPGVSVVGVASLRRKKAEEIAKKTGVPSPCCGIGELLKLDLDAVSIALPPIAGVKAATAALKNGLGVLMEKPLGINAQQADGLERLAQGQTAMIDYIFSGLDTFRTLKKWLDGGRLGELKKVETIWAIESWANQNQKWSWKTDALRGGGVLTTLGSHTCFLVNWFCGPAEVIHARCQNDVIASFAPKGTAPAEHRLEAQLNAGGVEIEIVLDNGYKISPIHRWKFIGKHATAVLENTQNDYFGGFTLSIDTMEGGVIDEKFSQNEDRRSIAFRRIAEDFIKALRNGKSGFPDFSAGVRSQYMLDSLRTKSSKGNLF